MLEDKLLITRFNRADTNAFREIYEKYKDDLLTLATALLQDTAEAEDVVHDVFVSFAQAVGRFELTGTLKGYLSTCVANCARNRIRSRQRHQAEQLDKAEIINSDSACPDQVVMHSEESERMSFAVGRLPYDQREVIILHIVGGMKFKAIAKSMGVSINTVQSRYRYGLDKLRLTLDGEVEK